VAFDPEPAKAPPPGPGPKTPPSPNPSKRPPAGRTRLQAFERALAARDRARSPGASFEQIAKEMSDDTVSKVDGGFAGFLAPWSRDFPALVDAASRLEVGRVSDPVETEAGFHVLQRISREEGKELESKAVVSVEGIAISWSESAGAGEEGTRDATYAVAAAAVVRLRAGDTLDRVRSTFPGLLHIREAARRQEDPRKNMLWTTAKALAPGAWSDPVEVPHGWAVVRTVPYLRAYVRHLVVAHRESMIPSKKPDLPAEDAHRIAEEARALLKDDLSNWDALVKKYSDETASKDKGGFMGEVSTAEIAGRRAAPEVEDAILALRPGGVSGVVETRFGFHVFWRVD
jgi:parvulin-like peptidyl-prolyl isomerase